MDTTWLTVISLSQVVATLACLLIYVSSPAISRKEYLLLGLMLLVILLLDVGGFIGAFLMRRNMNLYYNFLSIFTLPLLLFFYRSKIKSERIGNLIVTVAIVYVLFALVDLYFIQGPNSINSYTLAFSAVTKLILALSFFFFLIRELPAETITRLPMFWINTATLLFSAGTLFVNLSTDYLINVLKDSYINAFTLHNFVAFIHYLLIAVGLWLNKSMGNEFTPIKPTR